ncbi:hypothetical protein Pla108_20110 [Botrimarina colliarenosi]|uniref:PEP-CTERM protein-sorting domain-containing protein n=1 Tax=Botrimarina colliarenosi TaxID=2528001 RepID=A0A5C6AEW2_9BACT|nr:hypothetical protein [Botrimarina colliarenosi]TWT97858.1 hypothetical protein Pla108_20110 [Botrimarina colliarenosi]
MTFRNTAAIGACLLLALGATARGQHQTADLSPITIGATLPYQLELRETSFGAASLPTLHSYAAAEYDGKWVLMSGRTNGLHGFENSGSTNFPVEYQNRDIWVIDPVNGASWSRSLDDPSAGLTAAQIDSLSNANNQFTQIGDRLYLTGGYGARNTGGFTTFDTLSALDLDGLVDWVVTGSGQAVDHLRQVSDPLFKVTGGAMYEMEGRMHLVFGQSFEGGYNPGKTGTYTKQIRSFDIVDDGSTLSFANPSSTTPEDAYRRRDLNIIPVLRPDGVGGVEEGLTVLSGVFTESFGAWTVPVEIDASGVPSMADPTSPTTFKQAAGNYHAAKLGLYSSSRGEMNELLLGGITLQYYDADTDSFLQDDNFPFANDLTAVRIDSSGDYTQHYLGSYPLITDTEGNEVRFGANAEFFLAPGIATFENGVIDFDALPFGDTVVGYVFGGIAANAPHVRSDPAALSAATNRVFEVLLTVQEGDYNRDGLVDSADYDLWRDAYGSTTNLLADGNGDSVVNAADYTVWRDVMSSQAAAINVPEPMSVFLLLTAGLHRGFRPRRRG